jgi:hypothetical protein
MASKMTYECFVCKKNGFPDTRVYLDGKTEDMSPYKHKQQGQQLQQQQQPQQQQQVRTPVDLWNTINQKLDKIITLLEKERVKA